MYRGFFFNTLFLFSVLHLFFSSSFTRHLIPICKINTRCLCSANRYTMEVVIKAEWKENTLHVGKGGIDTHSYS